jgi:hypothetical protein
MSILFYLWLNLIFKRENYARTLPVLCVIRLVDEYDTSSIFRAQVEDEASVLLLNAGTHVADY